MDIMQTREGNLTLYGGKTPRVVIYKHESHKLHQAFNVKTGENIVQGMPVALTTQGASNDPVIAPYTGGETECYLGIAVTDSYTPAYRAQRDYPIEVTVAVEGYAICNYAAADAITPGFVKVKVTSGAAVVYNNRYPEVEMSTTTSGGSTVAAPTKFIALGNASAPSSGVCELVPVLVR